MAQLVARLTGGQEAVSSSLATRTKKVLKLQGFQDFLFCPEAGSDPGFLPLFYENCQETERWCDTADEVLDYTAGSHRLRDVITQATALDRTI